MLDTAFSDGAPSDDASTATAAWQLRLLDGWRLAMDEVVSAVGMRERRLLAVLALRGETARSRLAALLWPDAADGRAQGSLRAALWQLQRQHRTVLDQTREVVRLRSSVRVDVHELQDLAARLTGEATMRVRHGPAVPGRECHVQAIIASVVEPSSDAASVLLRYNELLPGWDDDWVEEERAPLHQTRMRAIEGLTDRLLERGDHGAALSAALRAAALDPLRESAHRQLIRVHLAEGNYVEAVRVYDAFRRRLRTEFGVTVSPRIVQLVRPVLARLDGR